jgi:LuxR family maltose regulon positive regulatory protein
MPIKILLVDDHPLFRKGLRQLFDEEPDMTVVGEAGDGQEAIARVQELSPQVIVMDITMPGLNGIEATRRILAESPDTKIVALSIHDGREFVKDMLEAGAAGYILKDTVPEELPNCVRKVMQGEVCLSTTITGVVVSEFINLLANNGETEKHPDNNKMESAEVTDSIVKTKLFRPPCPDGYVQRPRLDDKLDKGLSCDLTLISAPAGYGKSVLVSSWLESNDRFHAWLSLDEEFTDLTTLLKYFIAAVRKIFPKACEATRSLINVPGQIPVQTLAEQLSNDLLEIKTPFIVVLDDYGSIHSSDIHDLFNRLFKQLPQNLQLVFVTRRDPPFPLTSMRARGEVVDIRMTDLKFTSPEIAEFLSNGAGPLDEKALETVYTVTEGWPAALRLLQINLAQGQDPNEFLRDMCGDSRDTHEFLVTEVLSQQTPELRNCLLRTSILNRFNAPLCAVLCGKGCDGEEFIRQIIGANLFCIPMDDQHDWVRYHHLFQNLLRVHLDRRYSEDEIKDLHRKASEWFEENGYLEDAMRYALIADPPEKAAQLIIRNSRAITNNEQWFLLASLLDALPATVINQDPDLLILYARSCNKKGLYDEMLQTLDKIERLINSPEYSGKDKDRQNGEVFAMRSALFYHGAQGQQALEMSEKALELLPLEFKSERVYALLIAGLSRQMIGDQKGAYDLIYSELHGADAKSSPTYHGRLLQTLCFVQWIAADMNALKRSASAMLDLSRTHNIPETKIFGHYFLGKAQYQLNELQECEQSLRPVVADPYGPSFWMFFMSAQILSLCHEANALSDSARDLSESLIDRILKGEGSSFLTNAQALRAELALRHGHLAQAIPWANEISRGETPTGYHFMIPELTIARILVAQKTDESLKQADELLSFLRKFFLSIHNTRFLIETMALQALLFDARGNVPSADEKLAEAIELAEPGGVIRAFVDLGAEVEKILNRLANNAVDSDFLQKLRAAFENITNDTEERTASSESTGPMSTHDALLESHLTNREIEILTLLAQRLRNKEIAEKLFISDGTVKQHTINLYRKLGVDSRREAVAKALSMNILPQS